jgi:hypothetical protein
MDLVSLVVVLSLLFVGPVNAEACTEEQLRTIAQNAHLPGCSKFMGISEIFSFTALTDEQMKLICTSPDCMAMWEELNALGFGDCTFAGIDVAFQTEILDRVPNVCGVSLPSTGSGSSSSSDVVSEKDSPSLRSSSSTTSGDTFAVLSIAAILSIALLL